MKCQATRPAWEGGDRRGRQGAEPHFPLGLRWGMGPLLKRHKIHTAEAVFLSSILVRGARYPHSPNQSGGDDSLGLITTLEVAVGSESGSSGGGVDDDGDLPSEHALAPASRNPRVKRGYGGCMRHRARGHGGGGQGRASRCHKL